MSFLFRRDAKAVACLLLLSSFGARAQDTSTVPAAPSLQEVTVTGQGAGAVPIGPDGESVDAPTLRRSAQPTLGATLQELPGVANTYFGPNAGRPLLRGQDGDRVRILRNGDLSSDVSGLSDDHAVPADALLLDRVELLRGPSALRWGSNVIGGIVNLVDNRIPREPAGGFSGLVDLGYASGNREGSGSLLLEGGNERVAWHVDGFRRDASDTAVPLAIPCENPRRPGIGYRLCNSANQAEGGAVGATWFLDRGWVGASIGTYDSRYGTVAEDDVEIRLHSDRQALEGEWRLDGPVEKLHWQLSRTVYAHTEFEGGAPGTRFALDGQDARLEATHRPLLGFAGSFGLSAHRGDFSAQGDETFAPPSRTREWAAFIQEERALPIGRLSLGVRTERVRVGSSAPDDPELADRFAQLQRRFSPTSAAAQWKTDLGAQWQVWGTLSHAERAPKDYELFANGPHVATASWSRGDATLGLERSNGGEIGAQWKDGANTASVSAYQTRYANYIGMRATGRLLGEDGQAVASLEDDPGALPEYAYQGVPARFTGIEARGNVRLLGPQGLGAMPGGGRLDLEWRADRVRAERSDTGEPLPRIAPVRLGATLAWTQGPWSARAGFDRYAAQRRVPADGTRATEGYTLVHASLDWRVRTTLADLDWYVRVDNLGNRLAYSASSILTTTAYPYVPLPGRSIKVGLRATF